jgi:predicted TPR repeat methyltransferase
MSGRDEEVRIRWLERIYAAANNEELARTYDEWAEAYDEDAAKFGYQNPALVTGMIERYVGADDGAILDAGAGTGIMGEIFAILGHGNLVGIDLSEGMLAIARRKNVYREVRQRVMGEPLDFADDAFAAATAVGVLTVGHAPPEPFDELVRVTRPGGHLVFTVTEPAYHEGGFKEKQEVLEADGRWKLVEVTKPYRALPGAIEVASLLSRVYVYRVS